MGSRRNRAAEEQARLAAQAAFEQNQIAREQLAFSRQQWEEDKIRQKELDAIIKRVSDADLERAAELQGWARDDRNRYNLTFRPIEDQIASEARNYDAFTRGEQDAQMVSADIGAEYGAQRAAITDDVLSRGSQISAAQLGELSRLSRLDQATATGQAQTGARLSARDRGYALKMDAASLGRGLPSQALSTYGMSAQSGQSAVGNTGAGLQSFRQGGAQFVGNLGAAGSMFGNAGQTHMGAALTMRKVEGPTRWGQFFSGLNDVFGSAKNFGDSLQSIGKGVGSWMGAFSGSDVRIKENIKHVGFTAGGTPVYEFEYRDEYKPVFGHGKQIGVLAQQLEKVQPDAVHTVDGVKIVDYSKVK